MLNILDIIFLNMAFVAFFTGILINNFEKYLPVFIIKGYKYGSFAYQGSEAAFVELLEIPKAYYKHFYSFSSVFSGITMFYMFLVYYLNFSVKIYIPAALKVILHSNEPSVSATAAFIAMSLLTVQCIRRFYETHYLQVFAKTSKMNIAHYLVGVFHYFGCVVAIVGEAPLFCGSHNRDTVIWSNTETSLYSVPCILMFLWAWFEQFQTNIIFANMRKDKKSGKVVTEDHGIPHGRLFETVSSPHRLCEVIIYTVLLILIPTRTFFCIYLWVLGNQIQTAIQAQNWYKETFKNYPQNRVAIFPGIL